MAQRHLFNKLFVGAGSLKMCSYTEAKCFFRSQILLAENELKSLPKRKFSVCKPKKIQEVYTVNLDKNVKIPVIGFGTWMVSIRMECEVLFFKYVWEMLIAFR